MSIAGLTADAHMLRYILSGCVWSKMCCNCHINDLSYLFCSRFMQTQCLNHRYSHDVPLPVSRLVKSLGLSILSHFAILEWQLPTHHLSLLHLFLPTFHNTFIARYNLIFTSLFSHIPDINYISGLVAVLNNLPFNFIGCILWLSS